MSGGSAGGHLSLLVGFADEQTQLEGNCGHAEHSSRVQAVACFYPPTDFLNYGAEGKDVVSAGLTKLSGLKAPFDFAEIDPKTRAFAAITDPDKIREKLKEVSPITHVSPDDPPVLIMHGDKDTLVPIQQARTFLEKFGLKDLNELPPIEEFAPDTETERAIRDRLSTGESHGISKDFLTDQAKPAESSAEQLAENSAIDLKIRVHQRLVREMSMQDIAVTNKLPTGKELAFFKKLLEQNDLTVKDLELIEINEAFAAVGLASERELGIDGENVNVNGGAIALGHPVGSSGCRIVVTLTHEMQRRHAHYGLATLCAAGGQGAALVVESVNGQA